MGTESSTTEHIDIIKEKITYWQHTWEDLIDFRDNSNFGFQTMSPHVIINELIIELESGRLSNAEYINEIETKIKFFAVKDPVIRTNKELRILFGLLKKKFPSNDLSYLLELCRKIALIFTSGDYFNELHDHLTSIILNNEWNKKDSESIQYASQSLIIEFLIKDYSQKSVKSFVKKIFEGYTVDNSIVYTQFPHKFQHQQFDKKEDFYAAIKSEIEGLSLSDRLIAFKRFFFAEEKEWNIILEITGIIIKERYNFGDITLYSPNIGTLFSEDEFFYGPKDTPQTNIVIKLSGLTTYATFEEKALRKTSAFLDFFHCYFNPKLPVSIDIRNFLIFDNDGHRKHHFSIKEEQLPERYSLKIDHHQAHIDENLTPLVHYFTNPSELNFDTKTLLNAIHYYRKSRTSQDPKEQLLGCWIFLETVASLLKKTIPHLTTELIIKQLITSTQISGYLFKYGWNYYEYFTRFLWIGVLPKNIEDKWRLAETIYLKDVIDDLDEILAHNSNDPYLTEKIERAKNFYTDPCCQEKFLKEKIGEIHEDLIFIYKTRNRIVHQSSYNESTLSYYTSKIQKYASLLLYEIVNKHLKENNSLHDFYIQTTLTHDENMEKLKEGELLLHTNSPAIANPTAT